MKTSVKNMMMSLALMGCLVIGASDASAQGRSRSHGGSTSRSQSAAVSRSSNHSTAPTVSRNSGTSRSSSATPQVSRSSSNPGSSMSSAPKASRDNMSRSHSTTAPQVSHSSTRSMTTTPQVNRDNVGSRSGHGATTRGNDGNGLTRRSDSTPRVTPLSPSASDRSDKSRYSDNDRKSHRPSGTRPGGSIDNGKKGHGDNKGNGGRPGGNRPGDNKGNGSHDNKGGNRPGGNNYNPGGHDKGHGGGNHHGYDPKHRFDYSSHHYRDQFSWNHSHHNWSRPLPPPARAHRPAPLIWRRPVIPAGWHPYAGAPVIDHILGLMFGSLYEASLDHLYYNGYFIDGYADNIIYLRDVSMLNLYWPDAMLSYEYGKLANAQFVYHSSYYDRSRFDRAYNSLCRIYGPPVFDDGMTISWYGGNRTGWVTLTMNDSYGDYYTTMSIGY